MSIQSRVERYAFRGAQKPPVVASRDGNPFCSLTVQTAGTPSVLAASGGAMELTLTNNSEAQIAELYMGDILPFDIDDLVRIEFLVKIAGVAANTIAAIGLASARNATLDSVANHAWFRLDGSNALKIETDDGTTDLDDVATGETLGTTYKRLAIDFSVGNKTMGPPSKSKGGKADVYFYASNSAGQLRRVGVNQNFDMSAYAGNLQLLARVQKATGADVPVMSILEAKVEYRLPL